MICPSSFTLLIFQLEMVNFIFIFWIPLAAQRHQNPHAAPVLHYIEARTAVIGPYPVLIYAIRKLEAALMAPIIFPLDPVICRYHKSIHTAMTSCGNIFPSTRRTLSSNMRTRISSLRKKKKRGGETKKNNTHKHELRNYCALVNRTSKRNRYTQEKTIVLWKGSR